MYHLQRAVSLEHTNFRYHRRLAATYSKLAQLNHWMYKQLNGKSRLYSSFNSMGVLC